MATIAWIGLGHMGGPMSGNLVAAGHEVRGVDPDPACRAAAAEHGVQVVDSIAEAVQGADAVFTSLPRGEHVREVLGGTGGVWETAPTTALLLDTSTVDVETSRWSHDESAARGFRFVDSPVSGGIAGAHAGTLTFMLGGEEAAVAEAAELVEPMAGHVFRVGGPTMGIAAKLANNLMLFVSLLGLAEGSQLAAELGLDAETFFQVASVSSGDSWPLRTWYPVPCRRAPPTATSMPRSRPCSRRRTSRSRSPRARWPGCTCRRRASRSTSSTGSSTRATAARTAASS